MCCADGDAVEGHIIVHRFGVGDQPVIRNYLYAGRFSGFYGGRPSSEGRVLSDRVDIVDFTSNHVLDQHTFRHFAFMGVQRTNGLAIPQNRDLVGNPDHFFELV